MEAFSWLSDLFHTFGQVFPRLEHVRADEVAVVHKRGTVRELLPGMHWYWPVWSLVEKYQRTRNDLEMVEKNWPTKDRVTVMVNITVVTEVADAIKALVDTCDLESTACSVALKAVKAVVVNRTYDELLQKPDEIDKELTSEVRKALRPYGLRVAEAFISEGPVPSRTLRISGMKSNST